MIETGHRARRTAALLAVLALTAVAAALGAASARAQEAPQPSGTVLPVSFAPSQLGVSGARTAAAPLPLTVGGSREFNLLGALVRGRRPESLGVSVSVRTSVDGLAWSEWTALEFPPPDGPPGSAFDRRDVVSEPIWVDRAQFVQVDVGGPLAAAATVRRHLRLSLVSSPWDESEASLPTAGQPTDGVSSREGGDRQAGKPTIVTRRQWGANESWRSHAPTYGRVRMVFIHHTASSNSYTAAQAPAIVRSVYYYHTRVNGWWDIGYNFLVDRYGRVYEGRHGGVTRAVKGAHVLGFNHCSTGVSVIGTFSSARPPAAAIDALERLLAWKLDVHHVNPLGQATVRSTDGEKFPAGAWVRFNVISGHRQANYTTCPGNGIYGQIGDIRRRAAAIGQPKIYGPRASPAVFSPNGDGRRESSKAVCDLSQTASWKVEVRDDLKQVVRSFSGSAGAVAAEWNGRDGAGDVLPDGRYTYVFTARNDSGTAREAQVAVRIDSGAPVPTDLSCSPVLVSPNGDGVADRARIRFTVSESCEARVSLFDASGALVRRIRGWERAPRGPNTVWWDGEVTVDGARVAVPDGTYRVRVEARDTADCVGAASRGLTVNSTLGHVGADPVYISPNGDGVQDACDLRFALARRARVTVSVVSGSEVVRRWSPGEIGAGERSLRWDGRDGDGARVASGRYSLVVTAVNGLGPVTIRKPVRVDRYRPRPATATSAARVRLGTSYKLSYSVADRYSPSVYVTIVVRDAAGDEVRAATPGWVTPNRAHAWSHEAAAKGVYTVVVHARDKAGNREAAAARFTLTVR